MVSQMDSICERYAAGCTKTSPKILRPQNGEKCENAPGKARKRRNRVRFGCWRGVQPVRTGEKTRCPNQSEPQNHATHAKRKPAETHCFRRFLAGAEGLVSAAASVGAGRSPQATSAPRHALRRAQPHLVAKTFGTLTKNGEVSTRLTSPFLAGAEGLEPSARGFGVDVGERQQEREMAVSPSSCRK